LLRVLLPVQANFCQVFRPRPKDFSDSAAPPPIVVSIGHLDNYIICIRETPSVPSGLRVCVHMYNYRTERKQFKLNVEKGNHQHHMLTTI